VAVYLAAFTWIRHRRQQMVLEVEPRAAVVILGLLILLGLALVLAIGQEGTSTAVYLSVVSVMCLRGAWALGFVATLATAVELSAKIVPGWDQAAGLTFAVCTAAFAMWGVQQLMYRNADLLRAREENARLAVIEERNRFARDLHDILGHSLTVITVKAELAGRLMEADPARARTEVADLERLSREALADVRRAVEGYREITLPGELARARAALAAADIVADLPSSADAPRGEVRELFAWAVREGVTNVVRHSHARTCRVTLDARSVTVTDDGVGPPADAGQQAGHGLHGLRERAAALDATVLTRALDPGFRLEVRVRG
jgi:two-component system, NarL family, sensor histidine kinase DesK